MLPGYTQPICRLPARSARSLFFVVFFVCFCVIALAVALARGPKRECEMREHHMSPTQRRFTGSETQRKASRARGGKGTPSPEPTWRGRGKHGIKGQYATTRPHRLTVVHRGHLIGPKPDNRCSAWAVCSLACVFPDGPALGVHGWDRERLRGLKTEEVCHSYRSKWKNGPGSAMAVGTRVASWCS